MREGPQALSAAIALTADRVDRSITYQCAFLSAQRLDLPHLRSRRRSRVRSSSSLPVVLAGPDVNAGNPGVQYVVGRPTDAVRLVTDGSANPKGRALCCRDICDRDQEAGFQLWAVHGECVYLSKVRVTHWPSTIGGSARRLQPAQSRTVGYRPKVSKLSCQVRLTPTIWLPRTSRPSLTD